MRIRAAREGGLLGDTEPSQAPAACANFRNVSFSYVGVPVLRDIDFEMADGAFWLVRGPNGGGKTTLVRLLMGLLRPTRGDISVLGRPPALARASVGYVPQAAELGAHVPLTVEELVGTGLVAGTIGGAGFARKDAVGAALELTGIGQLRKSSVRSLSGGQRKRALISRALVSDPRLLLLDEPTANLDAASAESLGELLAGFRGRVGIMAVTHEPELFGEAPDADLWIRGDARIERRTGPREALDA